MILRTIIVIITIVIIKQIHKYKINCIIVISDSFNRINSVFHLELHNDVSFSSIAKETVYCDKTYVTMHYQIGELFNESFRLPKVR
jgi:hypothetical protein